MTNIGQIQDLKSNNDCSIFIVSSNEGSNYSSNNIYNGTFACYALWSSNGYPSITNNSPFYQLGPIVDEQNTNADNISNYGLISTIAFKSNINYGSSGISSNFTYDITVAVGTMGKVQYNNTPAYIKIFKFVPSYSTQNGLSTTDNPYINGTWSQIGYLDHLTANASIGFGNDIKLDDTGSNIYVGSPNDNSIFLFNYDSKIIIGIY